jgi:hypothetical protein
MMWRYTEFFEGPKGKARDMVTCSCEKRSVCDKRRNYTALALAVTTSFRLTAEWG